MFAYPKVRVSQMDDHTGSDIEFRIGLPKGPYARVSFFPGLPAALISIGKNRPSRSRIRSTSAPLWLRQ